MPSRASIEQKRELVSQNDEQDLAYPVQTLKVDRTIYSWSTCQASPR